ncbi:MAG: type I-F CRISPR-associated protein Csy2 [Thiothrix sp.]|nr:type I-F CRISPR-associated protein Csy2 [Thiothrix sp.]HPQ95666.1 type I-F CRISPR-associated protein Csy2 [Thiolinea sp.]
MNPYLLLKRLQVQNANALSSSFTFGFPAVTAFMGFAHALQRHLNKLENLEDFKIKGVGIVSHQFAMQDHQEGFNRTLKLTANPLDKDGNRPSFVEEGRCHFTASLLLEVENLPVGENAQRKFFRQIHDLILGRMKLAGGDILGLDQYKPVQVLQDEPANRRHLMPGHVLMERRDLMVEAMEAGQDALDALYGFLQVRHECEQDDDGKVIWRSRRARSGWLVPIATGFHGISELTENVLQARDTETPHRFAESLVTLGEFVMPHRLETLSDPIWRYQHTGDIYACVQQAAATSTEF